MFCYVNVIMLQYVMLPSFMSLYVCMYGCWQTGMVYICVQVCMYVYILTYICRNVHIYLCRQTCMNMYVCVYICMGMYAHIYVGRYAWCMDV